MTKNRLEAFSDGVMAIIITIMVLELRPPHDISFHSLHPLIPKILGYVMSFAFIGIYWNNHHHLLHTVKKVDGGILWANLNLMFWLSIIPFTTAWMGEHGFAGSPIALYGIACAFILPQAAQLLYALVALMWLVPDMRIERILEKEE